MEYLTTVEMSEIFHPEESVYCVPREELKML